MDVSAIDLLTTSPTTVCDVIIMVMRSWKSLFRGHSIVTPSFGPVQSPAVPLSFISQAWTSIPGAQWIWDAPSVTNPALDQSSTFSRGFYLYTTPSSATLKVAADNNLQTFVNGLPTTCNCNSCFSSSSQVSCNIASTLKPGWNYIVFTVINTGAPGSDYASNPAGLLYSLVIS